MTPQAQPQVQDIGDHRYQVHLDQDDPVLDAVDVVIQAGPDALARIAPAQADETLVVAGTVAFLLGRQRPDDLPPQLDLDDVAAAYEDFPAELGRWLEQYPGRD